MDIIIEPSLDDPVGCKNKENKTNCMRCDHTMYSFVWCCYCKGFKSYFAICKRCYVIVNGKSCCLDCLGQLGYTKDFLDI